MKYYDSYGWLSLAEIPGRMVSSIDPPPFLEKIVGKPYPNWTGTEWVMQPYADPATAVIPKENTNAPILAQIAALEAATGMGRTTREQFIKLGASDFLIQQDDQIAALRSKLEK